MQLPFPLSVINYEAHIIKRRKFRVNVKLFSSACVPLHSIDQVFKPLCMKTKSWITLFLLAGIGIAFFLLPSCEKLKEATTFKVKYDLPDSHYNIDKLSSLKAEIELFSQPYDAINVDSIAGSGAKFVERVTLYKLKFSIEKPETSNLNWLNSARVKIAPVGGTPVEIASAPVINSTDRTIDFIVKDTDLLSIIKDPFILTVYGNLNGNIPALPMEVLLQSGLELTISPIQ